ncbi:MAG: hypothetical protein IPP47_19710 [Bryobacterales bacterium]|nr:hypothetical protein [Bryobacterales bacterium]
MVVLILLLLAMPLAARPLPVTPMQMDPDQLLLSLREGKPAMPDADCTALGLWECRADALARVRDISIRWVQLDDDAELEAILTMAAPAEWSNVTYVFDRQAEWKMAGSFLCRDNRCDLNNMVSVHNLTGDSPPLLCLSRDIGGSGSVTLTTEAFHLRDGQFWPVFQVTRFEHGPFATSATTKQYVRTSSNRLVVHTIRERPPGASPQNLCEVWQWVPAKQSFAQVPQDRSRYCNPKTATPYADKSHWTDLPSHP